MVADYTHINKKSILVHQKGTRILGWQSKLVVLSNLTIFYPANPYFGVKLSNFVKSPTITTFINGCRLYGYQYKLNISSPTWFMKPVKGIKYIFIVQSHRIIYSQPIIWSKVEYFCGYFDHEHNRIWSLIICIPIKSHN